MEAQGGGIENMAAPGACAAARWGRGAGVQGRKSRPVGAPASSPRSTRRPQPPCKTRAYSRAPDSLEMARLEHGKGRGAPERPAGLRARRGTPSALHQPPGHKELSFESVPPKRLCARTLDRGGGGTLLGPQRLCSRVHTRHLERKLRKSHGVGADTLMRFVLSTTKALTQIHSPPPHPRLQSFLLLLNFDSLMNFQHVRHYCTLERKV